MICVIGFGAGGVGVWAGGAMGACARTARLGTASEMPSAMVVANARILKTRRSAKGMLLRHADAARALVRLESVDDRVRDRDREDRPDEAEHDARDAHPGRRESSRTSDHHLDHPGNKVG